MAARKRIFEAVFPSPSQKSLPTPQATPLIGTGSFVSSSFGEGDYQEDDTLESIKWERAWHNATEFLSLPNNPLTLEEAAQHDEVIRQRWVKQHTDAASKAIEYLLSHKTRGSKPDEDLLSWYTQEVCRHYLEYQLVVVTNVLSQEDDPQRLNRALRVLQIIQAIYTVPVNQELAPRIPSARGTYDIRKFKHSLRALISTSLSKSPFHQILKIVIMQLSSTILRLDKDGEGDDEDGMEVDSQPDIIEARRQLASVMISVDEVGLGGAQAERLFAEVMDELLSKHISNTYANQWSSPSKIPDKLKTWIEKDFATFINTTIAYLTDGEEEPDNEPKVTMEDVNNWKNKAISDLGSLRLKELFDIVVEWDDSRGAIEDLKQYVTSTNTRAHLTSHFSQVISQRLLQPGASTAQILQIYICIIRAFAVLDPKGVLLDRLARPIRRYLRDREDTVKIIVGGLLADPDDDSSTEVLKELSDELNKISETSAEDDDAELDWDNFSWLPDPVDAGPEYKKSKTSDVIGTLISLFESKDVFVKEFQNILGERLLQADSELDKETRLLELLKLRFGESGLQACEVMLKDVIDSVRTDVWVKREQQIVNRPVDISAKILSRLFWPALNTETFILPPTIKNLQDEYSKGFEKYKTSRKLTWLDALGEVTVDLELEDRTISEVVQTPYAALIYAFSSEDSKPIAKTAEQLVEELEMDEDLVENSLMFWVGKLVLAKSSDGSYSVLEKLPSTISQESASGDAKPSSLVTAAASASAAASAVSAVRSAEDVAEEKMKIFWQFIVGMLTNQGAMPLARIVMMLKLAVPGGFPYSNEELRGFLARRVDEGKLELAAGSYKIVKGAN
jgi:anaphase-promoting complex subunit 2